MKKISFYTMLFLLGFIVYYFYPEYQLPDKAKIDAIVVYKSKHQLLAFFKGKLIKTYTIALSKNSKGSKQYEGDQKTPEGVYYINDKNPNSGWHKNLGISYPNHEDIKQAKILGKRTGGDIKIHGLKNSRSYIGKFHRWRDWTLGCIALTNEEIDELYDAVSLGCKIEIKP